MSKPFDEIFDLSDSITESLTFFLNNVHEIDNIIVMCGTKYVTDCENVNFLGKKECSNFRSRIPDWNSEITLGKKYIFDPTSIKWEYYNLNRYSKILVLESEIIHLPFECNLFVVKPSCSISQLNVIKLHVTILYDPPEFVNLQIEEILGSTTKACRR